MGQLDFEKWHGLGNDFIVTRSPVDPQQASAWCDRRRGVGADGVLVIDDTVRPPVMVVINADGSRPEMCGNGLRCVVGFLANHGSMSATGTMDVQTDAGLRRCRYIRKADGCYSVSVDMGVGVMGDLLDWDASPRRFVHVDMGNPHLVTFESFDEGDVDREGPAINDFVPGGSNVEFVRVSERGERLDVVVWERGVGRTEACGTGACAVAVAAVATGVSPPDEPLHVQLPGGQLTIVVSGASYEVLMTGPAERTFHGYAGNKEED